MNTARSNPGKWGLLGAIVTALAASVCCVGPLVLLALGVSGAWAGDIRVLEPYRPLFIVLTLGFLAFAFYRAYGVSQPPRARPMVHVPSRVPAASAGSRSG